MYKIINLRTGEYLDGNFDTIDDAEFYIKYHINRLWENHHKILLQTRFAAYNPLDDDTITYYLGQPYETPRDKEYHFDIIEKEGD